MCVAVALKPGARLTHSEWDKCWTANPDGAGYAYIRRGRVIVERGLSRGDMWRRYLKDAEANRKSPMVLHFRIATHGGVCIDNTHPYIVDHDYKGQTVLAHNGIITPVVTDLEPNESDTRGMIRLYVRYLPAGWLDNPAIRELVEHYIGASLMVILTTDPKCSRNLYILNEQDGEWDGDRWFSNEWWRYGGYLTCSTAKGWTRGAWLCPAPVTGVWSEKGGSKSTPSAPSDVSARASAATVRVDSRGVLHRPYLPNGTLPLEGMSEDDLTDMMIEAIDAGYCERCLWSPCWCEGVCFDCTRPLDDCDCGVGLSCAAYYRNAGDAADGDTWLDTNRPRVAPARKGKKKGRHIVALTPQASDMTTDDWLELERSLLRGDRY